MRVRSFAAIVFLKIFVDNPAVLVKQFYRYASLRSRGGNRKARLHILNNLESRAANGNRFDVISGNWSSLLRFRNRSDGCLRLCWRLGRCCLAVGSQRVTSTIISGARIFSAGGHGWEARGLRSSSPFTISQQLSKVRAPRFVDQLRIAAKTAEQTFNVSCIRAKIFGDDFR